MEGICFSKWERLSGYGGMTSTQVEQKQVDGSKPLKMKNLYRGKTKAI
jgi:hypothetical protein